MTNTRGYVKKVIRFLDCVLLTSTNEITTENSNSKAQVRIGHTFVSNTND